MKYVNTVEELKRAYFKVVQTTAKPSPLPYKPRWLNAIYATINGYFWLSCPKCNKYFGGHELYEDEGGWGVCPECSIKIWNERIDKEKYEKKMQAVWDKCKHGKWKYNGVTTESYPDHDIECKKCGFKTGLACEHGGSVACQNCVDKFIKVNYL